MKLKSIILWYGIFSLFSLILTIIISSSINDWSIVYAILLLSPGLLVIQSLSILNQKYLIKQTQRWIPKKRIIISSMILYTIKSFLLVVPFLIGVLIDVYVENIFNIYTMIGFLCISLLVFSILFYLENKDKLWFWKNKRKGVGIDNGTMNE